MGSLNKMKKLLLLFAVATYVSAAAVPKLRVPPAVKVYEHNYGKREAETDSLIDRGADYIIGYIADYIAGYIVDNYPAEAEAEAEAEILYPSDFGIAESGYPDCYPDCPDWNGKIYQA